ncbi:MAG TPA: hypothetical protein DCO71_07055 [Gammaproteobacteria bacterium]|nr:hypothetical protein [Gammaproteobacteria bacterium]
MKKQYFAGAVFGAVLLATSSATTASGLNWVEWASSDATTLTGSSPWDSGTSFSYTVSYDQAANEGIGLWMYEYTFEVAHKDISHLIIEVTSGDNAFTEDNIFSGTTAGYSLDTFGSQQGNSNPDIPEDMYGLKWDMGSLSLDLVIISDRAPQWGDFYAKSGKHDGHFVYAHNTGFTNPDNDPQIDYASVRMGNLISDHILLPDSVTGIPPGAVVPVPAAIWLFGSGLLGLLGISRRKKTA